MSVSDRISRLRKKMREHQLNAYIIPSSDPHQSEYVAAHWKSREWLCGFTGSAGILVVTEEHAGLWTDSRYFIQAEQELNGTPVELHKQGIPYAPEHIGWLCQNLHAGARVGIDGALFSVQAVQAMQRQLDEHDIYLDYEHDLIANIWKKRPPLPQHPVFAHPLEYAGLSRSAKLQQVRSEMAEYQADYYLVPTLDDIAWVLNLRATGDVDFNPVFVAYLVIGKTSSFLFINPEKIADEIAEALLTDGVQCKSYNSITPFLQNRPPAESVLLHKQSVHILHYQAVPAEQRIAGPNLIAPLKACKNDIEIQHIRQAMKKDGVALVRFYRWLEQQLNNNNGPNEYAVAQKLAAFRSQQEGYQGESFAAIVGYQGNGAIVHYRPHPKKSTAIRAEGILLIDSGGQYIDGTTDITRTVALSPPADDQKRHYTYVLKGYIALDQQRFPAGTTGVQLDTLARHHLWNAGLNYGHGTGHGVGFFLNVHEGPQSISPNPRSARTRTPLEPGMLTSNEPGYYLDGQYGIRIENLVLCTEDMDTAHGTFLRFEPLTLFPIDTTLIDRQLLSEADVAWLNNYHNKVYQELAPLLEDDERTWLQEKCQAIT